MSPNCVWLVIVGGLKESTGLAMMKIAHVPIRDTNRIIMIIELGMRIVTTLTVIIFAFSLFQYMKLVSGWYSQYWMVMISLVSTIKKNIHHTARPEHGGWIS